MNTLLITSDIHGDSAVLSLLKAKIPAFSIETMLIAGDLCPSDETFAFHYRDMGIPILLVRGNCDSRYGFDRAGIAYPPATRYLNWGSRTLAMIHGNLPIPHDLKQADILVTGHTHRPILQIGQSGGIHLNPGSPSYPRSQEGPTYAVMDKNCISIRHLLDDTPVEGMTYSFRSRIDQ